METVLLIDDDRMLCRNLALALETAGYRAVCAHDAGEALGAAPQADLILLDVMLPSQSGFSLCEGLRALTDAPVIFLTSCVEEEDAVRGLDAGADDYIAKPFRLRELLSRIRANLRRHTGRSRAQGEALPSVPDMELTATEQRLLEYFMENRGKYVTREQILAALWDAKGSFVNDNTLSVHISRLREKLGAAGFGQIHTKRGVGYRWTPDEEQEEQ